MRRLAEEDRLTEEMFRIFLRSLDDLADQAAAIEGVTVPASLLTGAPYPRPNTRPAPGAPIVEAFRPVRRGNVTYLPPSHWGEDPADGGDAA